MTEQTSSYQSFISKPEVSFWIPLIAAVVGFAVTWGILTSQVKAQEKQIERLEEAVAKYPSEEYFNIRFQVIERDISEIKKDLKDHIN